MAPNEDRRDRWGEVSLPGDAVLRVGQPKSASALEPRCASTQALLASGRRAMHACFAHIGYLYDGTEEYVPTVRKLSEYCRCHAARATECETTPRL